MKTPLVYQISEYDCGMISFTNLFRYLYQREEIPPALLKQIYLVTLDSFDEKGNYGHYGTSKASVRYLTEWLPQNGKNLGLLIETDYLTGKLVDLSPDAPIANTLEDGGAVILRLNYGGEHYILATGINFSEGFLYIFDPYEDEDLKYTQGILLDEDHPYAYNRKVPLEFFAQERMELHLPYALGPIEKREAACFRRG